MPKVGEGNSATKVVFDPSLGRHGGTMYRGTGGRFTPSPNKGKTWYCQKSPTGAHHWIVTGHEGRCKYCHTLCELAMSAPSFAPKRGRES